MSGLDTARQALHAEATFLRTRLTRIERALAALDDGEDAPAPPAPLDAPPKAVVAPAPRKRETPTTKAPKGSVEPSTGTVQHRALVAIRAAGPDGILYPELGRRADLNPSYARQVVAHLKARGLVDVEGEWGEKRAVATSGVVKAEVPAPPPAPAERPKLEVPVALAERRTIKVEAITARDDRFKCLPLACTLTAGACVDRQEAARAEATGRGSEAIEARQKANAYHMCKSCPLGRQVAARLEAA